MNIFFYHTHFFLFYLYKYTCITTGKVKIDPIKIVELEKQLIEMETELIIKNATEKEHYRQSSIEKQRFIALEATEKQMEIELEELRIQVEVR